jgi:hypothetical protein
MVRKNNNPNKCYTCKPRGTIKDHIISETENFTFNHDLFSRPYIIMTSKIHYHDIYEIPDLVKLKLFEDLNSFVGFWNLNNNYQIIINNGDSQTHHHFHCKVKIDSLLINRMRRDHFTRINLEKSYNNININNNIN